MSLIALDNLRRCFDSVDGLLERLDAGQWATPSLCPGWTVRDVVSHLGSAEHMLLGAPPGSTATSLPLDLMGEWIAAAEPLDDDAFLRRYRDTIVARRAELATFTETDLGQPSLTPIGPGTYGRFMEIRVFDYWVHEQDVRTPLGLPGHEAGPAAEMAIGEIHRSLPYVVGKKIGLPDGMSITFELTGPVERTMHLVVAGRAALVDALDRADVTVTADSTTFALLACGRIDPQAAIDAGAIRWSGIDEWGERAARHLAFTM